jgi:arginyl-tRNA synthetase
MILNFIRQVHDRVAAVITQQYGLAELPAFSIELPPNRTLGDLAVTVAFQLARPLRRAPRAIAQELAVLLVGMPGISKVDVAPNGYLNLSLDRRAFFLEQLRGDAMASARRNGTGEKTIVEHTAINPNKAAHIGHLRNATLGDTLARALAFGGTPVEVQNYIDDLGVQVADIIVGFRDLEQKALSDIRAIADTTRFDYYCWDLYSRVTQWYDGQPDRLAVRARALHDLEAGNNETAEIGAFVADRIVRCHLKTMARLNIGYDLLTYEGDILRLRFWARAFDILKAQGAVFLQTEGRLAGCWVMRIDEGAGQPDDPVEGGEPLGPGRDAAAREKVIVRSNGVVTYVGKDIANQFWKFGLLGRDFSYRLFSTQSDGRPLWATTSAETDPAAPAFGNARRIYNVIDSRQMYLQALLSQALRTLGHPEEAERSVHFSYEMVALSHATAKELGYESEAAGDEARKPFVEVSGRKGLGVKIDDLLDLLTGKAAKEVAKRNPEIDPDERARTAAQIAVGAIRYFMLKFSRGKLIVFDIEEALSFEGETGPYLQYAVVRANNIFHKLREREGLTAADIVSCLEQTPAGELESLDCWAMVLEASRLDDVVDQVVKSLEFSGLAKYTFGLAQMFNAFYHRYPILGEERQDLKRWRAAAVSYVRDQIARALALMGIEVPARM